MNTCANCNLAAWERTSSDRLHPSGDGRCTWTPAPVVFPVAFYYMGGRNAPRPMGGYISRRTPFKDCPTWEEKK